MDAHRLNDDADQNKYFIVSVTFMNYEVFLPYSCDIE